MAEADAQTTGHTSAGRADERAAALPNLTRRDEVRRKWLLVTPALVVLALAAGLFLPHPAELVTGLAAVAAWVAVLSLALAVVETLQAKMRLLRVPATTLAGIAVALVGVVAAAAGAQL